MVNDKLLDGGGRSSYKNIICCGWDFYHKIFSDTRYSMGAYISLETLSKRIWWCMLQTKIILYPSTCKTIGHYGKGVCEYHTIWDNVFLFLITFIHEWVSFLGCSYVSCEECNQNVICFIFRIFQYLYSNSYNSSTRFVIFEQMYL